MQGYDDRLKNIKSLNSTNEPPQETKDVVVSKRVPLFNFVVIGVYLGVIMALLYVLWNFVIAPELHLPLVSWYLIPTAMLFYHTFTLNIFSYLKNKVGS